MTAKEAKRLAEKNAKDIATREEAEHKKRSEAAKRAFITKHENWKNDLEKSLQSSIEMYVNMGKNEFNHILYSHEGCGSNSLYGEGFLKNSEYRE